MQAYNSNQLVDLKYCERCGGLWLRAKGHSGTYCSPCSREMAEYPAARATARKKETRTGKFKGIQGTGVPTPQGPASPLWAGSVL